MNSLKIQSKLSRPLSKFLFQENSTFSVDQSRNYATQNEDDDIKWQWAVRKSPCDDCHKHKKKKGLISKILRRKNDEEELTNRHKIVEYKPKFWELEYYNYLMPECEIKPSKKGKTKPDGGKPSGGYSVCGPQNFACKNKQILVSLDKNDELKDCTEKLNIPMKEPFCLNEVCKSLKSSPKENYESKEEKTVDFVCLNDFIDCSRNSSTNNDGSKQKGEKDCN